MTTTAADSKMGEGNALRIGQIVTINGKQYQVSRLQDSVWVQQTGHNFAAQPVNKKTGKGWQAERLFMLGEIEAPVATFRVPAGNYGCHGIVAAAPEADLNDAIRITKAAAAKADAVAWYYAQNKAGSFDVFHRDEKAIARLLAEYPLSSAGQWDARVLSSVTEDVAAAHVARAIRTDAERDAKKALVDSLFNKNNWKLATRRIIVPDLQAAQTLYEALAYFCGGAEIHKCRTGYSVGSLGYYNYVGA